MEAVHGQRLGAEADRYSLLTRDMALERDAAATDKQAVAETHTKEVKDLVAGYEVQLQVQTTLQRPHTLARRGVGLPGTAVQESCNA